MIKFKVWLNGQFSDSDKKELIITDEEIKQRHGHLINPSRIMVKDLACKKGLFQWKDYNKIRFRMEEIIE